MRVLCIIPGPSCKSFSVTIDAKQIVDELKDVIRTKKSQTLRNIEANDLTLYKINVNALDEGEYAEGVNALAQNLGTLHKLNPAFSIGTVFPSGPLDERIEILVEVPATEPKTPSINPPPDQTLERTPVKPLQQLDGEIKEFLDKCRPGMKRLVQKALEGPSLLPSWIGPPAHQELASHVSNLSIPTVIDGRPSLLLHGLGEETHHDRFEDIQRIFSFEKHKVLVNTSGSGKTRLLLEGLCERWGFYFVAKRDATGIGSCDFERFMSQLDDANDYGEAKKRSRDGLLDPETIGHIRQVARGCLAQMLCARFLLLDLLVQEARNLQGGLQQKEHRRLWVLLQVHPRIIDLPFKVDVFTDFMQVLRGAATPELESRILKKRVELIANYALLQAIRNPTTDQNALPPFYCVLDDVQVTVAPPSGRLGEFMSENNQIQHPVLREIWRFWIDLLDNDMRIVLSGTGIDCHALEETLASNICKGRLYGVVHDIGAFNCREAQAQYIKRYLPADWSEPRWQTFLDRSWGWLRGRYRNTATLVSLMLQGGYRCPHRTINAYVKAFTGFTPTDADDWTSCEPHFDFDCKVNVSKLSFKKMTEPQVETLCDVVYNQLLFGQCRLGQFNDQVKDDFIQYGFARYTKGTTPAIDEPMAILAAMEWLSQTPRFSLFHRLYRDINKHSPRRNGFEVLLAFYFRQVFETAPALDEVFTFRKDYAKCLDLAWQHEEFELVTVVSPNNISVLTASSGCSSNVGLLAEEDEQLLEWISTNAGRFTFCFPPQAFGPALLFFVRSKLSKKIILVLIQAKRHHTVGRQTLIEGVRSITPSWLWKSRNKQHTSAETAPYIHSNRGPDLVARTKDALASIPLSLSLQAEGAQYPVLRVFASYPGEAKLERTNGKDPDGHPLATLHLENFDKTCQELDRDWFLSVGQ